MVQHAADQNTLDHSDAGKCSKCSGLPDRACAFRNQAGTEQRHPAPSPRPWTVNRTKHWRKNSRGSPELAVQADAIEFTEKGTITYSRARESTRVIIPDLRMGELTVTGPVHGNAVPSVDGLMVDNPWVYLRFPPGVKPPSRISVDGRMPAARLRRGARIKLTISHGTLTAKRTGIERAYLLAAARWFAGRTGWFERFAASRLAAMAGSKLEATPGRSAAETMRLADEHEVMGDLLQDRGAWKLSYLYEKTRWSGPIERPVPGGRRAPKQTAQPQPELIALARRIPKDAVFLIAPSAEALDGVAREMRQGFQWIAPFLAAVKNVYDPLFRAFRTLRPGDLIQSGSESGPQRFALYSRGVSLGELADVTLIVQFGSKTDLQAQLAMKDLKHLGPGILQRRGDLFLGWKETFLVFGRYQEDVRRTLELAGEGVDSDPYVWWHLEAAMRIEPRSIFAFVGYAAWTRLFSPENRQALARQRVARSELLAVEFCRMLFEWHEGRAPNGTRELLQTGYLRADELQHDDGRGSISLGTFAQSNWGRSEHLTPDDRETPFTVQEANGYRRFLEKWQPDLRMYARPVSFRMTATGLESRLSFLTSALDPRYFPEPVSMDS